MEVLKRDKSIKPLGKNRGTTLIEMVVCFALLGVFMACAAALISSITSIYYRVKGEISAREVSDIVIEKIVSEVDGAEYFDEAGAAIPNPVISADHKTIDLHDKTDTHVLLRERDSKLEVYYYPIKYNDPNDKNNRDESIWSFDESLYNGFTITDLRFYRGGDTIADTDMTTFDVGGINMSEYGYNIVLVLMKMKSEKYGYYTFYRFVRMYNIPETAPVPAGSNGGGTG